MAMTSSKRDSGPSQEDPDEGTQVLFTFDEENFELLKTMTRELELGVMGDTVRQSLIVVRSLQEQAKDGYTEVIVRNPKNQGERILKFHFLKAGARTEGAKTGHRGPRAKSEAD
jgi:hypothetical protein